jgi:hypothetical protein
MKLLLCSECNDIFNLTLQEKSCSCGKTKGKYLPDMLHAIYQGSGIPIGFNNKSFILAMTFQPEQGMGEEFSAFVIPKNCETFKKQ